MAKDDGTTATGGCRVTRVAVNDRQLTDELARLVMSWGVHADRYVKSGRTWIPKWRFQPLVELADAPVDGVRSRYTLKDITATLTQAFKVSVWESRSWWT